MCLTRTLGLLCFGQRITPIVTISADIRKAWHQVLHTILAKRLLGRRVGEECSFTIPADRNVQITSGQTR